MPMLFEYFSKQYKPSTLKRNDKQLRLAIHLAVERPSFEPADEWGSSMERRKKEIGIYFFLFQACWWHYYRDCYCWITASSTDCWLLSNEEAASVSILTTTTRSMMLSDAITLLSLSLFAMRRVIDCLYFLFLRPPSPNEPAADAKENTKQSNKRKDT